MPLLPFENPIGFGASDFLQLSLAAMLAGLALIWRPWIERSGIGFAKRTAWCMLALAAAPVILRLLLLPNHPVPTPDIYDEFGHLLVADTLLHFRLANPPQLFSRFFETEFVLQSPSYSSIYPIGQGIMLAFGTIVFGHPWGGVLFSTAALCALCYWMLRAWTTPAWALLGGLLAIIEFGPLCQWINSYWGGSFAAAGGCLVFGSLPRIRACLRPKYAFLLGLGLSINLLTRPYESIFLAASAVLYFAFQRTEWRKLRRCAVALLLTLLPASALILLHNRQVTGKWTTLPYALSQYQYGVPASLTFQSNPVPHRGLTPQQELEYKSQIAFRNNPTETLESYLLRLEYRVRYYRFFFLPPLFVALPFFFWKLRERRFVWVFATLTLFALGINFFPAFQLHYLGGVTCLFVLVSVTAIERLSRFSREAAYLVIFLCIAHFAFWYTLHLFEHRDFAAALLRYETWDGLNHGDPHGRIQVDRQIVKTPGKLLIFVRYSPQHAFQNEWIYNSADIGHARVVWARDLGPVEDAKLQNYFPDRAVWLLDPDSATPELTPYR
ncbi:MAG: hypothetical protein ACRD30_01865 [Bryobacteraceae bacterium]